jgi:hypothetical protein
MDIHSERWTGSQATMTLPPSPSPGTLSVLRPLSDSHTMRRPTSVSSTQPARSRTVRSGRPASDAMPVSVTCRTRRNKDPMYGCQIGTKCPILHAGVGHLPDAQEQGSYVWLPNRYQASYSACHMDQLYPLAHGHRMMRCSTSLAPFEFCTSCTMTACLTGVRHNWKGARAGGRSKSVAAHSSSEPRQHLAAV